LKVKDEAAGKRVKCPGCGSVLTAPAAGRAEPPRPARLRTEPAVDDKPLRRRPPAAAPKKPSAAVQILLSVLGLLVVGVVALAAWWFSGAGGSLEGSWQEFSSAEGAFTVLLPGEPTASTKTLPTVGGAIKNHIFAVERPKLREAFRVGYVDYPVPMVKAGPADILRGELELLVKSFKQPTMIGRKDPWGLAPGAVASQVTIATADQGAIRARMIMVKQRVFTIVVRSPNEDRYEEIALKIYDSFKIGNVPDHLRPEGATAAFSGHTDDIEQLALSAQGDKLATVSKDGTLRVWTYPAGKEIAKALVREDFRTPNSVAFAPEGDLLATGLGGPGEQLLLWDLASRNVTAKQPAGGSATFLSFTADSKHLLFITHYRIFRYDGQALGKGQEIGEANTAVLSPDGKRLFAYFADQLRVYDPLAKAPLKPARDWPRFKDPMRALALSGDGRVLAVASGQQVFLWDALKLAPLPTKAIKTVEPVQLALSEKGDYLAVRSHQRWGLYHLPEGKELLQEERPDLHCLQFGPDGRLLLASGAYLVIREPPFAKQP
jgi:hypothetical protein